MGLRRLGIAGGHNPVEMSKHWREGEDGATSGAHANGMGIECRRLGGLAGLNAGCLDKSLCGGSAAWLLRARHRCDLVGGTDLGSANAQHPGWKQPCGKWRALVVMGNAVA